MKNIELFKRMNNYISVCWDRPLFLPYYYEIFVESPLFPGSVETKITRDVLPGHTTILIVNDLAPGTSITIRFTAVFNSGKFDRGIVRTFETLPLRKSLMTLCNQTVCSFQ